VYSVAMLILAFRNHAQTHYRAPDGAPTSVLQNYRDVLKPLRRLQRSSQSDKPQRTLTYPHRFELTIR